MENKNNRNIDINEYSYTRAISFNLKEDFGNFEIPENKDAVENSKITEELEKLNNSLFKKLFFIEKKDEKEIFKFYNLKVKREFLKIFFKNEYQSLKKIRGNRYDVISKDLDFIRTKLKELISSDEKNSLKFIIKKLININNKQGRNSDISFYVNKLLVKNDYIELILSLTKNIDELFYLKNLVEKLKEKLQQKQLEFSNSKKLGFNFTKGSLNYYTIDKKEKGYFDEEIKKEKDKEEEKNFFDNLFNLIGGDYEERNILKEIKKKYNNEITIYEKKEILKDWKAKVKSSFFENLKNKNFNEIKDKYYFFREREFILDCIELTLEIENENKNKQKNYNNFNKNKWEKSAKQKRGDYLIKKGFKDNSYFKNWINFINEYKKISVEAGKIKARLNNLEIQKIESQKCKYWTFLVEKQNKKFLWCIPKEKRSEFKEFLKEKKNMERSIKINCINSLTKRALHKLCFSEESTFIENMPYNIKKLQSSSKKATNDKNELKRREKGRENYKKENNTLKADLELEVMKKVLNSEEAKKLLDLKHYNLDKVLRANTIEKFEEEMTKDCYKIEEFGILENEEKNILEKFEIISYEITSYDLENINKNELKRHTQIWNKFWKNKEDSIYRLNPEINLFFKKRDEYLEPYLLSEKGENELKKHRNLNDSFKVGFSFSICHGKRYANLSYKNNDEIQEEIDNFNKKFNKQNWNNYYKYGIDRGNIELATLCIAKFNEEDCYIYKKNKEEKQKILKPTFPNEEKDIKCYELKKEYFDKEVKTGFNEDLKKYPLSNISYFTENEDLFNKKSCSFIDLTKAKVVKKKIILNGDVLTYLKLKKEGAKKLIWQDFHKDSSLEESKEYDKLVIKLDGKTIYYYETKYENLRIKNFSEDYIYNFENIFNRFKVYLKEIKEWRFEKTSEGRREELENSSIKHIPTENKINNLRKAIVSNMIGVINFLQKKYPGFIILEDLNSETIHEHFKEFYINIGRVFENSLIQNFQTKGLVPTHIKNLIEIRENRIKEKIKNLEIEKNLEEKRKKNKWDEKKYEKEKRNIKDKIERDNKEQYGAIIFTSEKQTSGNCPYCENEWTFDKETKDKYKFIEERYVCGKHNLECGFDTKNIIKEIEEKLTKEINDPDKVAAYNIAKKSEKLKDKLFKNGKQY